MSRASITKAHNKIQELSWEPSYVSPVEKYATDYTFEKAPNHQSPNILLNEMSPEQRDAHVAEYKRGGPAGRRPTTEVAEPQAT